MSRDQVTSGDLRRCGELAQETLSRIGEEDWLVQPPRMTWTRLITASHICGANLFYATQLATGSPAYTETVRQDETVMKGEKMPALVRAQANLLAAVADGVAPETRAFHGSGSPDAEGYLAMGCAEVLLHCWDAMNGTGNQFAGDVEIADRVLQRLFPWAPLDTPRWQTLLWVTGRGELPGYDSPGETWGWHPAPLEEWDGVVKRSTRWKGR